jgi:hypothetical protein
MQGRGLLALVALLVLLGIAIAVTVGGVDPLLAAIVLGVVGAVVVVFRVAVS